MVKTLNMPVHLKNTLGYLSSEPCKAFGFSLASNCDIYRLLEDYEMRESGGGLLACLKNFMLIFN